MKVGEDMRDHALYYDHAFDFRHNVTYVFFSFVYLFFHLVCVCVCVLCFWGARQRTMMGMVLLRRRNFLGQRVWISRVSCKGEVFLGAVAHDMPQQSERV
eukprot:SAG31_NODE_1905_length_6952_cov_4.685685_6_plen_100_part_00